MFRTIALLAALASVPVLADDDRRDRYNDRYNDRNSRYDDRNDRRDRDRRYGRDRIVRNRASIVDRTVADLRRAQSRNRYDNEKREHFERAFYHLNRFRADWDRNGSFNKDRLNDAIERIDKLAHSDQIQSRDREILRRDLADLRAFRSSGGGDRYGSWR